MLPTHKIGMISRLAWHIWQNTSIVQRFTLLHADRAAPLNHTSLARVPKDWESCNDAMLAIWSLDVLAVLVPGSVIDVCGETSERGLTAQKHLTVFSASQLSGCLSSRASRCN